MDIAKNGYEVFEKVKNLKNQTRYDVILLDLNMPIMNGYEACTNISNLYQESLFDCGENSSKGSISPKINVTNKFSELDQVKIE